MGIQLSFLGLLVSIAVASTRLIYHDGTARQFRRMALHCRMLAVLIVVTTVYSASIGFSIHEQCMQQIRQKDNQIRAMAKQKISDGVDRAGEVVLTTVGGNEICIGDDDGLRDGTGNIGCSSSELRRGVGSEASERGRSFADSNAGNGCNGPGDDGMVVGSELFAKLREWSDDCFSGGVRITPSKSSVSF